MGAHAGGFFICNEIFYRPKFAHLAITAAMIQTPREREAAIDLLVKVCLAMKQAQDAALRERLSVDLRHLTRQLWVDPDRSE